MTVSDDGMSPSELLATAERLLESKDQTMYRAAILEAIAALEANVAARVFPVLPQRTGEDLAKWLEQKTRMDFDSRLELLVPLATGLKVDKKDRLWTDYKKAKDIRNKVTHSGKRVTYKEARSIVDVVYEWIEYLNQAQQAHRERTDPDDARFAAIGRLLQASARLERLAYRAAVQAAGGADHVRRHVVPDQELLNLGLIDEAQHRDLVTIRILRNRAAHALSPDEVEISESDIARLNQIGDEVESKLG